MTNPVAVRIALEVLRWSVAGLALVSVAGCGSPSTPEGPPPGARQVTIQVKGMSDRLKLF
jgi:hypothetical protein